MSTKAEATPRPWKIRPCECGHPACTDYFINVTRSDGRLSKEDAELIVKAVNNYNRLVEALKIAHSHASYTCPTGWLQGEYDKEKELVVSLLKELSHESNL